MPSFDVVSKVDWAEIGNALDQARRELAQRFDFKGTGATLDRTDQVVTLLANADDRVDAALDVLKEKLVRRKVSLKHLEVGDIQPAPRGFSKRLLTFKEGIDQDRARAIVKLVKQTGLKLQAAIQGDAVRVSGKKRDDLQVIMQKLKTATDIDLDLQFVNLRD